MPRPAAIRQERTPCLEIGCHNWASERGRCAEHQREPFSGNHRAQRLPDDWRFRRLRILARDNWQCQVSGCTAQGRAEVHEVDHIIPGDDHSPNNLRAICTPHHREKTAQEGNAAQGDRNRRWTRY